MPKLMAKTRRAGFVVANPALSDTCQTARPLFEAPRSDLSRTLINPRANQADLLRRERFGRWAEPSMHSAAGSARRGTTGGSIGTRSAGRGTARSARTARSTGTAPAWLEFGRHRLLFIELRHCEDQNTIFAVPRDNDLALLAAFKSALETVEAQAGLGPLGAVAPEARGLEQWSDIGGVGDIRFGRRRWKFAQIDFRGRGRPAGG